MAPDWQIHSGARLLIPIGCPIGPARLLPDYYALARKTVLRLRPFHKVYIFCFICKAPLVCDRIAVIDGAEDEEEKSAEDEEEKTFLLPQGFGTPSVRPFPK